MHVNERHHKNSPELCTDEAAIPLGI